MGLKIGQKLFAWNVGVIGCKDKRSSDNEMFISNRIMTFANSMASKIEFLSLMYININELLSAGRSKFGKSQINKKWL